MTKVLVTSASVLWLRERFLVGRDFMSYEGWLGGNNDRFNETGTG